jgi:ribosome-associated toxin RatA of RatAB toxin-antitoxin module
MPVTNAVQDSIVVHADPDAVWDVIADFEAYPEWQPEIREAEVLETDGYDVVTVDDAPNKPYEVTEIFFKRAFEADAAALGNDTGTVAGWEQLDALIASMKREWRYWADDPIFRCDWEQSLDFDLMLMLAVTHKIVDGEAVGLVCWRERKDSFRYSTCIHLVDPDLLDNPMGQPDSDRLRAGVELDEDGVPVVYHFRRQHPADVGLGYNALVTDPVPAREDWGRPRVVHLFEKRRAGQHRGIGDLVSSLRRFKTLEAYTDAELRSKVINALVVAQYTSTMGADMLAEIFGVEPLEHGTSFVREIFRRAVR